MHYPRYPAVFLFPKNWLDASARTFYSSPIDTRLARSANPVAVPQRTSRAVRSSQSPNNLTRDIHIALSVFPDGGQITHWKKPA
ncbi:hypothetical protein HDF17_000011 [Granulicella arctica]|uniref:Uncharacterized protein n=1 Tax=Granulicella arctica TaxID=940613 RepID=A0A7Y9TEY1_9BACT|nr:hypothetical protein [Granulicella arctica]